MTKTEVYRIGQRNLRWELLVTVYQNRDLYKHILTDKDEPDIYIGTEFHSPATANTIDETILSIVNSKDEVETLHDLFIKLQSTINGPLFYERLTVNPQLTDGVILLSID